MYLTIDSPGSYLHVKDEMFEILIRTKEKEIKKLFSPNKLSAILINTKSAVSGQAVTLGLTYSIDIIFTNDFNDPVGRIWYPGLGSTTKIRKAQLFASVTETGLEFVKEWICGKINNRIEFLKNLKKHRPEKAQLFDSALKEMSAGINEIQQLRGSKTSEVADSLRGIEGNEGRIYFGLLSEIINPEFRFNGRSYRPARDIFNAFLNYSYGYLYSKTEKALIIAGVDPYLGFLHRDDYNMLSMVYDFVEPYRAFCEEAVFRQFSGKKVNKSMAEYLQSGVQINKEGKALLVAALTKQFDEDKIKYKGRNQTVSNLIRLEAHSFASALLKKQFNPEDYTEILTSKLAEEIK